MLFMSDAVVIVVCDLYLILKLEHEALM